MNQTRVFLIFAWLMVATLLWMEWGKFNAPKPVAVPTPSTQLAGTPASTVPWDAAHPPRHTVRWAGKLRHLAIGRAHANARIVILLAGRDTLVIRADTGEIIAEHHLDEARNYQPKNTKTPLEGGASDNHVLRHPSTMSRDITEVEPGGIEPPTSCLQSRRSTN